ncbi:MAG: GNAT family N-acetyltransferase [Elusimicrobia bacterium]|nr:GNAT family N-acetyltransferase [Elusimicrobiota bacterium]
MSGKSNPADGPFSPIETLSKAHLLSSFDCGKESLNAWLKRYALLNQQSDSAQTYDVERDGVVAGYYALTAGSVRPEESPERISKGLAKHPIGVVLLARLASDKREQGKGLGTALLKDALMRIMSAADAIGARAVLVYAIDEEARRSYEHFGFERSPVDELELMLLMKDLRAQSSDL